MLTVPPSICAQDGTETVFKVKPATKFEKVFTVFYSKKVRFHLTEGRLEESRDVNCIR